MPLRLPFRHRRGQRVGNHLAIPDHSLDEPPRAEYLARAGRLAGEARQLVLERRDLDKQPLERGVRGVRRRGSFDRPLGGIERLHDGTQVGRRRLHQRADLVEEFRPCEEARRDPGQGRVPRQSGLEPLRIVETPGSENLRFVQRPELTARAVEPGAVQDAVDRPARRFVGALHRGEVRVRPHIVRREKEVGDACRGIRPGPCRPFAPAPSPGARRGT
jgi:hypothetical protein